MDRRSFLCLFVSLIVTPFSGCRENVNRNSEVTSTISKEEECLNTYTKDEPREPYNKLSLFRVPKYVNEYDNSAVIKYQDLDPAAQRAVDQALNLEDSYIECISDGSSIIKLYKQIEAKWGQSNEAARDHTYIFHDDQYYAIHLVKEGDNVLIDSIRCTEDSCPKTPTDPSE